MLVFGDQHFKLSSPQAIDSLNELAGRAESGDSGLARHAALVGLFTGLAQVVQAETDEQFAERGRDERCEREDEGLRLLVGLAGAIRRSWKNGVDARGPVLERAKVASYLSERNQRPLLLKSFEGFAHYALYPEALLEVIGRLEQSSKWKVVGLRSIGTALAPVLAEALGASLPVTVRPTGHPFDRKLRLGKRLEDELLHQSGTQFAVVDEGPGLSGSSMACVAEHLHERGVAWDRIMFFPGHGGAPGAHASAATLATWNSVPRFAQSSNDVLLGRRERLRCWIGALVGEPVEALTDLSGGLWRSRTVRAAQDQRVPSQRGTERRKFLAETATQRLHIKFAGLEGLGHATATAKVRLARALACAGFTPRPLGVVHGFLVEEWEDSPRPDFDRYDQDRLLYQLGRYLAFRAERFPMQAGTGASPGELLAMVERNVGQSLGEDAARQLTSRWAGQSDELEARARLTAIDGRLHRWEWLEPQHGVLLKTDALDHHCSHDLIGSQDVSWDVAGAAVEFNLDVSATRELSRLIEKALGRAVDEPLIAFHSLCYPAFQLGAFSLAADAEDDSAEKALLDVEVARYKDVLVRQVDRERVALPLV